MSGFTELNKTSGVSSSAATSPSLAISVPSSTSASTLIMGMGCRAGTSVSSLSVTDNNSNTWTQIGTTETATLTQYRVFTTNNVGGGVSTVTLHSTTSGTAALAGGYLEAGDFIATSTQGFSGGTTVSGTNPTWSSPWTPSNIDCLNLVLYGTQTGGAPTFSNVAGANEEQVTCSVTSRTFALTVGFWTGTTSALSQQANGGSGTAIFTGGYYTPATPTVTSVSPTDVSLSPAGWGGNLTINGTNFNTSSQATDNNPTVLFNGGSIGSVGNGAVTLVSNTQLTIPMADLPSEAAGAYDVQVQLDWATTATGASDQITYHNPSVTSLSVSTGPAAGGTATVITGNWFIGATAAKFASTNGTSFSVVNNTTIDVTSPAGSGTVDVEVVVNGTSSSAVAGDHFVYIAAGLPPPLVVSQAVNRAAVI